MSVMPPGVGVDSITVQARMETNPLTQKVQPRWSASYQIHPSLKATMKDLPPDVVSHRCRPLTLSFRRGVTYEIELRRQRVATHWDTLQSLKMPTRIGEAIQAVKGEAMKRHMKVDVEWLRTYIQEHSESSVLRGIKWPELGDPAEHIGTWKSIYDSYMKYADMLINGDLTSLHFEPMFNQGSRARYNGDPAFANMETLEGYIERSRLVAFHPRFSAGFALIPKENKAAFYRDCIEGAINEFDNFDLGAHLTCPLYDGGKSYRMVDDAFLGGSPTVGILGDDVNSVDQNGEFTAQDGSTWDSYAGTILGDAFTSDRLQIGHPSVASGVMWTSIDDTIASAWLMRDGLTEYESIMERQKDDEEQKFFLGLSYTGKTNPEGDPHIIGVKLMADDAPKVKPLPENQVLTVKRTNDEYSMLAHQSAFYGKTADGERLLDLFGQVDAGDWISPGRLVDRVIGISD